MPIDSKIKNLMGKDKKTVTQLARELPDVSSISQAEEANIMGEEKFKIIIIQRRQEKPLSGPLWSKLLKNQMKKSLNPLMGVLESGF